MDPTPTGEAAAASKAANKIDEGVLFTADLTKSNAKSRSGHRNAGNSQFNKAMQDNPELKQLDGANNTARSVKAGNKTATRKNPEGTEWDHNTSNKYQLDLRTISNHRLKTAQDPNRHGGFKKFWNGN